MFLLLLIVQFWIIQYLTQCLEPRKQTVLQVAVLQTALGLFCADFDDPGGFLPAQSVV